MTEENNSARTAYESLKLQHQSELRKAQEEAAQSNRQMLSAQQEAVRSKLIKEETKKSAESLTVVSKESTAGLMAQLEARTQERSDIFVLTFVQLATYIYAFAFTQSHAVTLGPDPDVYVLQGCAHATKGSRGGSTQSYPNEAF